MNIFTKIVADEYANDTRLGCPSPDYVSHKRRMNAMATMTGMRGFSAPPMGVKVSKGGQTRKEREAPAKAIYERNLAAEVAFREAHTGQPGWGLRRISRAIERRLHLKSLEAKS